MFKNVLLNGTKQSETRRIERKLKEFPIKTKQNKLMSMVLDVNQCEIFQVN